MGNTTAIRHPMPTPAAGAASKSDRKSTGGTGGGNSGTRSASTSGAGGIRTPATRGSSKDPETLLERVLVHIEFVHSHGDHSCLGHLDV